jgi:glucosamine-6-phosphate deaminase
MAERIFRTAQLAAEAAAEYAIVRIRHAIHEKGQARVVAATGVTQIELLARLVAASTVDWARVELFQLDEYIGVGPDHPASFTRFIQERLVSKTGIRHVHLLDGLGNPESECQGAAKAIRRALIDITLMGIGENGHLAFNEPPADFTTEKAFLTVDLAEQTRVQQMNEGWFSELGEVPRRAITMSIPQILKSRSLLCIATGARKAEAVQRSFAGAITEMVPASALQGHSDAMVFLDREAAKLLRPT